MDCDDGSPTLGGLQFASSVCHQPCLVLRVHPRRTGIFSVRFRCVFYCFAFTSLALLLTKRFAFSLALIVALGSAILAPSATKYDYLQTKLAAHDLYFHLTDWAEIEFFLAHYSKLAVVAVVALCFVLAFLHPVCGRSRRKFSGPLFSS